MLSSTSLILMRELRQAPVMMELESKQTQQALLQTTILVLSMNIVGYGDELRAQW